VSRRERNSNRSSRRCCCCCCAAAAADLAVAAEAVLLVLLAAGVLQENWQRGSSTADAAFAQRVAAAGASAVRVGVNGVVVE
jgi:hypothetical protein